MVHGNDRHTEPWLAMRFFLDAEFIENGETILPLSLAIVPEEGHGIYLVFTDVDRSRADQWVAENVLPHLDVHPDGAMSRWVTRTEAPWVLSAWVAEQTAEPEFWADYCSYDWVLLCQLFGKMIDLPDNWPMFCNDIQQEAGRQGWPDLPDGDDDHNAYQDAVTTRARWRYLQSRRV